LAAGFFSAAFADDDWARVAEALGKSGTVMAGDVYRVGLPRTDLEVTAVHNHMLDEQPRLFFMHFWAHGDAKKLAEGLKATLAHVTWRRAEPWGRAAYCSRL
jgi:hypothetical protein